jgi:DNA-binding SARP family transcriptional activator
VIWREQSAPGPLAVTLNNIGWDMHMLGQYEAAMATYGEALNWARRCGSLRDEARILAGQADVYADLGDLLLAGDLYHQAMIKVEQIEDSTLATYLCYAMARLDRRSRNYVGALEWLRRASLILGEGRQSESPLANLDGLHGTIMVEMGYVREGRVVLDRVCGYLTKTLTHALTTAEKVGYDQMLLSEVISAYDLLDACRSRLDLRPRIVSLLARAATLQSVRSRLGQGVAESHSSGAYSRPTGIPIEVRALGHSLVLRGGTEVARSEWSSLRIRELFLFLVDRAPVHRDLVLETFWPNKPQVRALNNLYQTLFRLRRAIGHEAVTLVEQECRLSSDLHLVYDVYLFESQAQAALAISVGDMRRVGALASAYDRYTGDYLADLPVEWALMRRQELSDLFVNVLRAYADELVNLTRYAEARDVLSRALAIEPFRDELHSRMLVCLAGLGRRHEVVNHYRVYRETLRTQLGLDPPPEIRALYARLVE